MTMFFHSKDDITSGVQMMKLFIFCESYYNITIKNPLQFEVVIAYLANLVVYHFNKSKAFLIM